MKWYLAKIVFRIVCGNGEHAAQFDEQLRLISGRNKDEAFEKAMAIGRDGEDSFYNNKQQLVCWQFINVAELYILEELIDGAELYARIKEVDDADTYINFVNRKAAAIQDPQTHHLLHLI
jgi:hypothetical protein